MTVRRAVIVGVLVVAAFVVVIGAQPRPSLTATNSRVLASRFEVPLPAGVRRCQMGEYVPADARTLRVFARAQRSPSARLLVELEDDEGRAFTRSRVTALAAGDPLEVALPSHPRVLLGRLCLQNLGPGPVLFAGNRTPFSPDATLGPNLPGQRQGEEVRADYFRADEQSWFAQSPAMARRFPLFKASFVGSWTMWVALGLIAAIWLAAIRLVLRHLPRG